MELDSCILQKIKVIKERARHIQQDCKEWKHCGDWLRCGIIHYVDTVDEKLKKMTYETVERTTRTDLTGVDGVDVITLVSPTDTPSASGKEKMICLVAVYRPPVDSFSIEFPSGLVDPGETLQTAAKRELAEETGYSASEIRFTSPTVHADPWKSNENSVVCMVTDVTIAEERATLKLDETECLEPIELHMRDLRKQLDILQKDYGFVIDAKLYCFAIGLEMKDS